MEYKEEISHFNHGRKRQRCMIEDDGEVRTDCKSQQ